MADVTVPASGAGEPAPPGATGPTTGQGPGSARTHWWWMIGIWFVLSAVICPIFWFQAGPHIPPGTMTDTANGQQFDFNVLLIMAIPVVLAVWVYMGYALWRWRASRGGPEPVAVASSRGHLGIQVGWMSVTSAIVLGLFVFGTYELVAPAGAGGGEGPNPVWTPSGHVLQIQVIAQQWLFTYRYPSFGAFETQKLVLPADTQIAFHVTSLDVIHSFWAYQLGVKADANPAQDNVAFTHTTSQLGGFTVRCSELCGLWHGSMFSTTGRVESKADFETWAKSTEAAQAAETKLLPPFAYTYVPDANSAGGSYYPNDRDPYSNVEMYGTQKGTP